MPSKQELKRKIEKLEAENEMLNERVRAAESQTWQAQAEKASPYWWYPTSDNMTGGIPVNFELPYPNTR